MKKGLYILLVVALVLCMVPATALAASNSEDSNVVVVSTKDLAPGESITQKIDGETTSVIVKITNNGPAITIFTEGDHVPYGNWYTFEQSAIYGNTIVGTTRQRVFIGYEAAKGGCYFGELEPIYLSYLISGWFPYAITSQRTSPWNGVRIRNYFNSGSTVVGNYIDYSLQSQGDYAYIWANIDIDGPQIP
jgi:hypothetical protein